MLFNCDWCVVNDMSSTFVIHTLPIFYNVACSENSQSASSVLTTLAISDSSIETTRCATDLQYTSDFVTIRPEPRSVVINNTAIACTYHTHQKMMNTRKPKILVLRDQVLKHHRPCVWLLIPPHQRSLLTYCSHHQVLQDTLRRRRRVTLNNRLVGCGFTSHSSTKLQTSFVSTSCIMTPIFSGSDGAEK